MFLFISCFVWIVSIIIIVIKLHNGVFGPFLPFVVGVRLVWLSREFGALICVQNNLIIGIARRVVIDLAILHVFLFLLVWLANVSSLWLLDGLALEC